MVQLGQLEVLVGLKHGTHVDPVQHGTLLVEQVDIGLIQVRDQEVRHDQVPALALHLEIVAILLAHAFPLLRDPFDMLHGEFEQNVHLFGHLKVAYRVREGGCEVRLDLVQGEIVALVDGEKVVRAGSLAFRGDVPASWASIGGHDKSHGHHRTVIVQGDKLGLANVLRQDQLTEIVCFERVGLFEPCGFF